MRLDSLDDIFLIEDGGDWNLTGINFIYLICNSSKAKYI